MARKAPTGCRARAPRRFIVEHDDPLRASNQRPSTDRNHTSRAVVPQKGVVDYSEADDEVAGLLRPFSQIQVTRRKSPLLKNIKLSFAFCVVVTAGAVAVSAQAFTTGSDVGGSRADSGAASVSG